MIKINLRVIIACRKWGKRWLSGEVADIVVSGQLRVAFACRTGDSSGRSCGKRSTPDAIAIPHSIRLSMPGQLIDHMISSTMMLLLGEWLRSVLQNTLRSVTTLWWSVCPIRLDSLLSLHQTAVCDKLIFTNLLRNTFKDTYFKQGIIFIYILTLNSSSEQ